jgi:hypothetical protein
MHEQALEQAPAYDRAERKNSGSETFPVQSYSPAMYTSVREAASDVALELHDIDMSGLGSVIGESMGIETGGS